METISLRILHCLQEARAWPSVGERPGLRKLGSVSCEVLAWSDEEEMHNVHNDDTSQPYINVPRIPPQHSASPSTDSEYESGRRFVLKSSDSPSVERGSEHDATDNEVTFRYQENDEAVRDPGPSQVFEILYDYKARNNDELNLKAGTTVKLIQKTEEESWFFGECEDGSRGLFPGNYVKLLGGQINLFYCCRELMSEYIAFPLKIMGIFRKVRV
uniref:SH3 domain-containing protein n=1 Tax=Angiostrongylus cantonensis TaxID=6313 RepID=A0A0K0DEU3_ANGCA